MYCIMNKKELRSIYLEKRLALTDSEYVDRNKKLVDLFFTMVDLNGINVIHIFLPMVKYKEPNTWPIIERIKKENPAIRFSIPKVNTKNQLLDSFYFDSQDQLKENKWGIQEPQFGDHTDPKDIDLVIVPLLAIDKRGHRVGYGKGYYDKLLSQCKPTCLTVGVTLFEPIENIEDVNKLDVALNTCITPKKFKKFN